MTLALNGSYRAGTIQITFEMSLLQVNFGNDFLCQGECAEFSGGVGVVVGSVSENCKGRVGGGANLRGLIMTPYYSMQELPSFAHHITCMA